MHNLQKLWVISCKVNPIRCQTTIENVVSLSMDNYRITAMSITMSPDDLQNLLAAAMKQAMTGIATQVQPFNPQPHSVPSCAIFEQSFEKWATMLTINVFFCHGYGTSELPTRMLLPGL